MVQIGAELVHTIVKNFVDLKYVLLSVYGIEFPFALPKTILLDTRVPGDRCTSLFDVVAVVSQVWNG